MAQGVLFQEEFWRELRREAVERLSKDESLWSQQPGHEHCPLCGRDPITGLTYKTLAIIPDTWDGIL